MMRFYPLLFTLLVLGAQARDLQINPGIRLPKDSLEASHLIQSLEGFLEASQSENSANTYVLPAEKLETYLLLDEFKGIEASSSFNDEHFYQPQLCNVAPLEEGQYWLQISYFGQKGDTSILRASFDLIAHPDKDQFKFASPLKRNTRHWKEFKVGKSQFFYQDSLNEAHAIQYDQLSTRFDGNLKSENKANIVYCCENLISMERLLGLTYKIDYNGYNSSVWAVNEAGIKIMALANDNASFENFDPHDLWHARLSMVISRRAVDHSVDEGCAYLYGGSWGYTWDEILKAFKAQIASDPSMDWRELKEKPQYFQTGEHRNSADYIVCALLVREIEAKHGFEGVWEFLNIGPREKGNAKFYQKLERLLGISAEQYNAKVWELIEQA
ncbi:hypothetical protein [Croceimicrobium sp.]|uniref:hypothetical protein n=1 Tax=Croceimicrobium sp. TaxID=2828340 RepID=UPI003BAD185E